MHAYMLNSLHIYLSIYITTVVRFVFQLFIVAQPTVIISVLITIHFLHPATCTITPLNPNTLTATGGALVSGTTDVRIQCVCAVTSSQRVRWYDIKTNFVLGSSNPSYVTGSPYFIRNGPMEADNNVTLVIPTFNDSYDGTYNCGIRVSDTEFTSPSAAVILTIMGELMINTVSYLYVAT